MKIDSTDASSVTYQKTQETKISTNEIKPISSEIRPITNDSRQGENAFDSFTLTHMTPMDKKELPLSDKVVIDAIDKANKAMSGGNRRIEFSIHEKTNEIMVKVIDSDTGDIIREIPREKTLDMVAKLWEMAGITVDERR